METSQAEQFQNDRFTHYHNHYGVDIYHEAETGLYWCDVYSAQHGRSFEYESKNLDYLLDLINVKLVHNYYHSLLAIADSLEEKKKDFNNPVSNYENVVNAFLKKVNDSFL